MKKPEHIVILPMYFPEKDSSPHRGYMFYEQAIQLARIGYKVGIIFVEQRPSRNFTWKKFKNESHFQISVEDNGMFKILRLHGWNPKLSTQTGGQIWSYLTRIAFKKYTRLYGKPDLIHAHFAIWAGHAATIIRKRYHIPFVITEHASSITGGNTPDWQRTIFRSVYNSASRVICVGTFLKSKLMDYVDDPDKITVVPNFVDTDHFRFVERDTNKARGFTFISVANLSKRKGYDDLLTAFSYVFKDEPQVSLVIVGDGDEAGNLNLKVDELGISHQVTFIGRMGREELVQALKASDAFVLASYAETFGIVFIEAMATGMPAIGTVCGGPEDIITPESGYLVNPGDINALANSMSELYKEYDTFDKKQISESIRERFDIKLTGPAMKRIYNNIKPE